MVVPVGHAKHAGDFDHPVVVVPVGHAKHADNVEHPVVVVPVGHASVRHLEEHIFKKWDIILEQNVLCKTICASSKMCFMNH